MSNRPTGQQGGSQGSTAGGTSNGIVTETPDETGDVVPFRGLGWLEYQEARRRLREYNARRRARRGGGR